MATQKPAEKRIAAIRSTVVTRFLFDNGRLTFEALHMPFEELQAAIKAAIEDLRPLGRTERWNSALSQWQAMVDDEAYYRGLEWALTQGAIWAGYAAL